ncbi:unnamed protein product [Aspergillus oryzae]|nr:unnamed protein product [Aspergillus oryzae]GMF92237.1 unnamed protein product [Aspergillus oryzae]
MIDPRGGEKRKPYSQLCSEIGHENIGCHDVVEKRQFTTGKTFRQRVSSSSTNRSVRSTASFSSVASPVPSIDFGSNDRKTWTSHARAELCKYGLSMVLYDCRDTSSKPTSLASFSISTGAVGHSPRFTAADATVSCMRRMNGSGDDSAVENAVVSQSSHWR